MYNKFVLIFCMNRGMKLFEPNMAKGGIPETPPRIENSRKSL